MASTRQSRPGPQRLGLWGWLGLGFAALAGLATLRLLRPSDTGRGMLGDGSRPSRPRPGKGERASEHQADDRESLNAPTPDLAWVPGPAGSLRVAEVNPEAAQTVIFVHGLAGRLEHWVGAMNALPEDLRGLAFDLPGHGASDPADDQRYSVESLAQAIGAVADSARVRRCVLVAHSVGAQAALRWARRQPARVAGLLLVDPVGDLSVLSGSDRDALFGALRRDPREALEDSFGLLLEGAQSETATRVREDLRTTDASVAAAVLEAGATESPVADLDRLVVPVWSATTSLNRQPNALHRLSPLVHQVDLPSAGHWLMLDSSAGFEEVLNAFLGVVRDHDAD